MLLGFLEHTVTFDSLIVIRLNIILLCANSLQPSFSEIQDFPDGHSVVVLCMTIRHALLYEIENIMQRC